MQQDSIERQLSHGIRRLVARGLLGTGNQESHPSNVPSHSTAALSIRIAGQSSFAATTEFSAPPEPDRDPHHQRPATPPVQVQSFADPAKGCRHGQIYHLRDDVGAVLTGSLDWTSALHRLGEPLPALFDEQVRQLGPGVSSLEMPGGRCSASDARGLRRGNNAFLCQDHIVCLGTTIERLVLNVELLEKCAQAFVLARLTGTAVRQIPWFVRFEATRRLRRDERRAAEAFASGNMPSQATAY